MSKMQLHQQAQAFTAIVLCLFSFSLFASPLTSSQEPLHNVKTIYHQTPKLTDLVICQGGGCAHILPASINHQAWQQVLTLFAPLPKDAATERQQVQRAIGLIEQIVGAQTGTDQDLAGTFNGDYAGQQDCNDEAVNTTTYLKLLMQHGVLRFHQVGDLHTRNFFWSGWPHTTASILETQTGTVFAVDSWFYHNGHAAVVIPLAIWEDNFTPTDSPVFQKDAD